MKQQLDQFLKNLGYGVIPSNLPEFTIYFQVEHHFVNVVHVVEDRAGLYLLNDQFEHIKQKIHELFKNKGYEEVHILSIVLSDDIEKVKKLCLEDKFCWMLKPIEKKLMIYENQAVDFYGLKDKLEDWLQAPDVVQEVSAVGKKVSGKGHFNLTNIWKKSYITITLTVINVLVFVLCTFTGELYKAGALNAVKVLLDGEYYRLLSSIFLHWDINHLFGNMLIFFFLGDIVEKELGHGKYLLVYLAAGISGGLLSMGYGAFTRDFANSVGASGAIFGVVGALFWLVIMNRGRLEYISIGRVLFLIVYFLYSGFTGSNVDNSAHIGGLIAGFVFAMALYWKKAYRKEKEGIS